MKLRSLRISVLVTIVGFGFASITAKGVSRLEKWDRELMTWYRTNLVSLQRAADEHNPAAQVALAVVLRDGAKGTEPRPDLAESLLKQAIGKGYTPAKYQLAILQITGQASDSGIVDAKAIEILLLKAADEGYTPAYRWLYTLYSLPGAEWANAATAMSWLRKGVAIEDASCEYTLAEHLADHPDGPNGPSAEHQAEAAKLFEKSAKKGYSAAQIKIGLGFRQLISKDEANYDRAMDWFRKAADQGNPNGMIQVALLYAMKPAEQDEKLSDVRDWLNKAIELGSGNARHILKQLDAGQPIDEFEFGLMPDPAQQLDMASRGDPTAMFTVAEMFRTGHGFPKNPKLAAQWYRKAAETKYSYAMLRWGECLEMGFGVPAAPAEAAKWYERAAAKDTDQAVGPLLRVYQNAGVEPSDKSGFPNWLASKVRNATADEVIWISEMYWKGKYVPKDIRKALEALRLSAIGGFGPAQNRIGECFQSGLGGTPDLSQAILWYRAAATNQVPEAYLNLAKLYVKGTGVPANLSKAWIMASIAAKHRLDGAAEIVRQTESQLTSQDLENLKFHLSQYWDAHPDKQKPQQWVQLYFSAPLPD